MGESVITALVDATWLEIIKLVSATFSPLIAAYSVYLISNVRKATKENSTEQKKLTWVAAETLASATGDEGHAALASEAKQAYVEALPQVKKQTETINAP